MINAVLLRKLNEARITRQQLAKHLRMDERTINQWLNEPLNKERSEILYRGYDEIKYHRYMTGRHRDEF